MSTHDPLIIALRDAGVVPPSPDRAAIKQSLLPAPPQLRRGRARLTLLMAAALAVLSGNAVADRPPASRPPQLAFQDDTAHLFDAISGVRPIAVQEVKATVARAQRPTRVIADAPAPAIDPRPVADLSTSFVRKAYDHKTKTKATKPESSTDDDERDDDERDDD